MEENENKKVSSKYVDPNRLSKIAYDLVQISKQRHSKNIDINEIAEIKTIKKMCCDENLITCETGLTALQNLVSANILNASQAVSILISMLPSASNHPPIVNTLGMLLLLDVRLEQKSTKFNLTDPQHPFITILKNDREKYWPMIYSCIQYAFYGEKSINMQNTLQMLQPVFRYIFCDPSPQCKNFKNELLSLFFSDISVPCSMSVSNSENSPIKFEMICRYVLEALLWQKMDMNYCLMVLKITNYLLLHLNDDSTQVLNALAPYLALSIKWLIENGHNPTVWIDQLHQIISIISQSSSLILLILSDVSPKASISYIHKIIQLGNQILLKRNCNKHSAYAFAAANLKWLIYPTMLRNVNEDYYHGTQTSLKDQMKLLYGFLNGKDFKWEDDTLELLHNNYFAYLENSQIHIKTNVNILKMTYNWGKDDENIIKWLRNFTKHEKAVQEHFFWLICGFVLSEDNSKLLSISLDVLENIVNFFPYLSYSLCVLLLFKLSREIEPSLQLKYLLLLSRLSVDMTEVPIIIRIMDGFTANTDRIMTPMAMRLYLTLWKNELRIYPYLHKLLTKSCPLINEMSWEINVSKAAVMRDICRIRPETYGKGLVPLLSEILNTCGYDNSGMPSALAIEAITELCKAHVTDIAGTWKALKPKLAKDNRRAVKISLCKMFGEIPALKSDVVENEHLTHDAISTLWSYITGNDLEVKKVAIKALQNFSLEDHKLKLMPQIFRSENILPKEHVKNPGEVAKKPEDILRYIPGVCWLEFLKKIDPALQNEAQELIISLIEKELQSLPRGIFYLYPGKAEPMNYANLPQWSIIRTLTDHLRKYSDSNSTDSSTLIKNILKILSYEYSKLLPPLNWSFLENIQNNNFYIQESLALSAKQAPSSSSAKFLTEEYVKNFSPKPEDIDEILYLHSILPRLCNAVQPNYIRAFVDKSLRITLDSALNGQTQHFEFILEQIKLTLMENDVLETNKTVLVSLLENILPSIPPRHYIMKCYSQCATEFPSKFIEKITSPSNWWQITPVKIEQAIAIRSAIASKPDSKKPLVWLNDILDVVGGTFEQEVIVLREIVRIITNRRNDESYCRWIIELMCRAQASVFSESNTPDSIEVTLFLFDVFMSCTIVLAGYDIFTKDIDEFIEDSSDRTELFQTALQELLSLPKWADIAPQVIEWLHKLSRWKEMPSLYQKIMEEAILALRGANYCMNDSKWPRLFDFKYDYFVRYNS